MKTEGLGRLYSSGPSLQKITRVARKHALEQIPGGVFELDIRLSFISLLVFAIRRALDHVHDEVQKRYPLLLDVLNHKERWLAFIQDYFECCPDVAKQLLSCILSPRGKQSPNASDRPDWLPHLGAVQQEICDAARLLSQSDSLYQEVLQKRADCSVLHVY